MVTVAVRATLFVVCEPTRMLNDSPLQRATTARTCGPSVADAVTTYAYGRRATAAATCDGSIRTLTSRNYQSLPCLHTLAP